jgi:hypothetical protein
MTEMTPEQEAAHALDFNVAREDLGPAAQAEYDRLQAERNIGTSASVAGAKGWASFTSEMKRNVVLTWGFELVPLGLALIFVWGIASGNWTAAWISLAVFAAHRFARRRFRHWIRSRPLGGSAGSREP